MEERIVYVSRLTRLPLLGADGSEIGRINDAVIDLGSKPPRVNGFVVAMQRRRVFVGDRADRRDRHPTARGCGAGRSTPAISSCAPASG